MSLNVTIPEFSQNDVLDFYNNTLVPAAQTAMQAIQDGAEVLYQEIKKAEGYWEEINVQVQNWTETQMSPLLAKITQGFWSALPGLVIYSASSSLTPLLLTGAFISTYKLYELAREGNISFITPKMLFNTCGVILAQKALLDFGTGLFTLDSNCIALALLEVVGVIALFDWSGFTKDVYSTLGQSCTGEVVLNVVSTHEAEPNANELTITEIPTETSGDNQTEMQVEMQVEPQDEI